MKNTVVRLESLSIENFKNIKAGQLSFANSRKAYKTSILGLYGQNGSGKTALIDAIELLQLALKGQTVPAKFADYIHVESGNAVLRYEFSVADDTIKYRAFYDFKLKSEVIEASQNLALSDGEEAHYRPVITEEILSYSYEDKKSKERKSSLIDTTSSKVFAPLGKYNCLIGKDKDTIGFAGMIICYVQLVAMLLPVIPTEISLRRRFDKNGNRKDK